MPNIVIYGTWNISRDSEDASLYRLGDFFFIDDTEVNGGNSVPFTVADAIPFGTGADVVVDAVIEAGIQAAKDSGIVFEHTSNAVIFSITGITRRHID